MLVADAVGQMPRHPLGGAAGVGEDQRGAVGLGEPRQPVVDLAPDLVRHHRLQRRIGKLDGQIALTVVAGIDDGEGIVPRADEEPRHLLDRLLRRRHADPQRRVVAERCQPLQRQRQMRAALVAGQRMDLVHNHRLHRLQHLAPACGRQQDIERLRCGDENMRRLLAHLRALPRRCVAGAHRRRDVGERLAALQQRRVDRLQRLLEILVDIVRQRLQRRHIEHPRLVRQRPPPRCPNQPIDRRQKRRQRFARTRRRRDQRVLAPPNRPPRLCLHRCRAIEQTEKGLGNGGVEIGEWHGERIEQRGRVGNREGMLVQAMKGLMTCTDPKCCP